MARPVLTAQLMKRSAGPFAAVLSQLTRLGVVGGAALALLASTEAGDRANGTCPAGETCAPATPNGLLFEGAPLGVWPALSAHTIAAGGRQTFRLTWPDSTDPFDLPFVAKVSSADHQVVATGADRVSVAALRPGTGNLRILDGSGQLYDRLSIDSAEIGSIRAAPSYRSGYPSLDPPRWSLFAGGQASVTAVLSDPRGATVVDEDLAVRAPVPLLRTSWDTFSLTTPPVAGTLELAIDAGDLSDRRVPVPVVDSFDELAIMAPAETGIGGDVTVCFSAWERGATAAPDDDVLVVGVPREYQLTGPATPLVTQQWGSCLELHTTAAGTVRVDASVGARTWTATIDVRGSMAKPQRGLIETMTGPVEGERATLAREAE